MTSIQQVNALVRVIDSMIDKYYNKRGYGEPNGKIAEDIKNSPDKVEIVFIDIEDFDEELAVGSASISFSHDNLKLLSILRNQKEELEDEWRKMKENLQLYKDLLLVSKDSPIDKPELPKELEKFLFMAVDELYGQPYGGEW